MPDEVIQFFAIYLILSAALGPPPLTKMSSRNKNKVSGE
jgi:hypothetical protein